MRVQLHVGIIPNLDTDVSAMNKKIIVSLLLVSGLAIAGTGTFYDASNFGASSGGGGGGGTGDVVGPASATDNAVCRYDTTTGKLIQNSLFLVDDTGSVVIPSAQSLSISGTGSNLTIVGSTSADATRPSILLDDTGPSITSRADSYAWKSGNNASTYMALSAGSLSTSSSVTADFPGSGSNSTHISSGSNSSGQFSLAIGFNATASNIDTIAIGETSTASNQYSTAIGNLASSTGYRSVGIGYLANSGFFDSIAIGTSATVTADNGISIGASSTASNDDIAVGAISSATGPGGTPCVTLGRQSSCSVFGVSMGYLASSSQNSVSLGRGTSSTNQSVAIGQSSSTSSSSDSIAIGNGASVGATHNNSVCIGASCTTTAASQFQIGASGTPLDMRSYGKFQLTKGIGIWNTTPPAAQPAAIPDATGGAVIDVQCRAALNNLLAAARGMGMIAP